MSSSARSSGALFALLALIALGGCDRSQRWIFRNGPSLGPDRPPAILAEIYDGECGPCEPSGSRGYCDLIEGGRAGDRPQNLTDGESYCFMGTALDADGVAFAVGCDDVTVGGGAEVEITLAPIEADRIIARRCAQDIDMPDAGPPFDAGPGMDAGVIVGRDAGPPIPDAGPGADSGLQFGDPVIVRFIPQGPGSVFLTRTDNGRPLGTQPFREGTIRNVEAYVGFRVTVDPDPDPDAMLLGTSGACGTTDPCIIALDRYEDIFIRFADAPM